MAGYLGNKPKLGNYTVDEFTTSSAQASSGNFTLSQTVTDLKTLEVSVGGIDQPQSAYTISGTTLAFGASVVTLGDIVIARHAGESISYPSLEDGTVTVTKIGSGAVTDVKIGGMASSKLTGALPAISGASLTNLPAPADNSITLAKMAGGTDGQIITYSAAGDPVAIGPGTAGQVLTSAGANLPQTFADAGGGAWTVLATDEIVNQTSVEFTGLDGETYNKFGLAINDVIMNTNQQYLALQFGNASSGFLTNTYYWHIQKSDSQTAAYSGYQWGGNSNIRLSHQVGYQNFGAFNGFFYIGGMNTTIQGNNTNRHPRIHGTYVYGSSPNGYPEGGGMFGGWGASGTTMVAHDRIKLFCESGNLTNGRITLYGLVHE